MNNNLTNKIYLDKLTTIEEYDIKEDKDFFDFFENNADTDLCIDYLPLDVLKHYDVRKKEDVNRLYKILYNIDTPILPMVRYNKKYKIIELKGFNDKELIFYRDDFLVHVGENTDADENDNSKMKHYFTTLDFSQVLEMLLKKSNKFFHYDGNKTLDTVEINLEDFLKMVYSQNDKTLNKTR